jgi:hypothetical protein
MVCSRGKKVDKVWRITPAPLRYALRATQDRAPDRRLRQETGDGGLG